MTTRKACSHSQTSSALPALRVYGVQQRERALSAVASREVIQRQRPHHHSSKVVLLHVANLKKIIRAVVSVIDRLNCCWVCLRWTWAESCHSAVCCHYRWENKCQQTATGLLIHLFLAFSALALGWVTSDWHQQEHKGLECVTTRWHQQGLGCIMTYWHQQEHQGFGCVTTHWHQQEHQSYIKVLLCVA